MEFRLVCLDFSCFVNMHCCFFLMSIPCTGAVFVNTSRVFFNPAAFLVLTLSLAHVWITAKEPLEQRAL